MSVQDTTIEGIRARYRFTKFAYEGDDPPQAQRDIDFLLSEVKRMESELEFWQKENAGSHALSATAAGLLTDEQNVEFQRMRGRIDLATENGLKDTARLVAIIDCNHCALCEDHH